jgi:hypothetical protein
MLKRHILVAAIGAAFTALVGVHSSFSQSTMTAEIAPKVGDIWQEYYKGRAEDTGTIVGVGQRITVPYGTFYDCVQIRVWSKIGTGKENEYYCPVGSMAKTLETATTAPGEAVW